MMHPLISMINRRNKGISCGIPSYCTANELVIEASMEKAMSQDDEVLIEATANQVNQSGGYTGMKPADFRNFVYAIADRVGFNRNKLILGGDHLGPLTWSKESEETAMSNAKELVREYVLAGFTKIHLDTSMKLGSDSEDELLKTETIAQRGAELCRASEEAYNELLNDEPDAVKPVYIIGSEVPIPGGAQDEEGIHVTTTSSFKETIEVYSSKFASFGLQDAWERVIAVVVQPGVEFGDSTVHRYDRNKAKDLCDMLKQYPGIVFEGHSTDYQSPKSLKEMVEDGIAILKVGPALTFGLRESLFALAMIEEELIDDEAKQSNFTEVLEAEMLDHPENWKKYYHGDQSQLHLARKYSYSDRSRYYLGSEKVKEAINKLFENLDECMIPMNLLRQYMPMQYNMKRDGKLLSNPRSLAKAGVTTFIDEYIYAVKENYIISSVYM